MKIKVVFDVNIWVSYFITNRAGHIVDMVANNDIILYRSSRLAKELANVLERPKFKKYFPNGIQHLILLFEIITSLYHTVDVFSGCEDPKDNYLFDLAYRPISGI